MAPLLAVVAWIVIAASPAVAHEGEEGVPAVDSFAAAMALLQVQPDMADLIGDKIGDGLDASDTEGVDLGIARDAQAAFQAGDDARALELLAEATGMTPAEALAFQMEDVARPSVVPVEDQLGVPGSAGRPSAAATAVLGLSAAAALGLGAILARRTR